MNTVDKADIAKKCKTCKQEKKLTEFFLAPQNGAAQWSGSSMHCIECHDAGLVVHGYGYYGVNYKRPDWM